MGQIEGRSPARLDYQRLGVEESKPKEPFMGAWWRGRCIIFWNNTMFFSMAIPHGVLMTKLLD